MFCCLHCLFWLISFLHCNYPVVLTYSRPVVSSLLLSSCETDLHWLLKRLPSFLRRSSFHRSCTSCDSMEWDWKHVCLYFTCLFDCLLVYMSIGLTVGWLVGLSVCLLVCPSVYWSVSHSIHLSVGLNVCWSVDVSVSVTVGLFVYRSVGQWTCLSVCLTDWLSDWLSDWSYSTCLANPLSCLQLVSVSLYFEN